MQQLSVDDIENEPREAAVLKHLTEPLGLDALALNYFELAPGDSFSGSLHTHTNQEEVFYVLDGEATFETLDETVTVGAGEIVRFPPGEYQEGRNESDDRVVALALGAPQESGETRIKLDCRECGDAGYYVLDHVDDGVTLSCPECGNVIRT